MSRAAALIAAAVLLAAGAARAAAPAAKAGPTPLDPLKALAGDWIAAEDSGEMVKKGALVSHYAVSAGGTAVVETVFPGSAHEMVTVYHLDGNDLVLTHYCMEGNQPRMRAKSAAPPRLDFVFDGGTNIDPRHDRHMNSATLELVSADEIRSTWTELADGQPVLVAKSHLVRKAR